MFHIKICVKATASLKEKCLATMKPFQKNMSGNKIISRLSPLCPSSGELSRISGWCLFLGFWFPILPCSSELDNCLDISTGCHPGISWEHSFPWEEIVRACSGFCRLERELWGSLQVPRHWGTHLHLLLNWITCGLYHLLTVGCGEMLWISVCILLRHPFFLALEKHHF